jgi:hypothetical protein
VAPEPFIPVVVTGGLLRCVRCLHSYTPVGWRVRVPGEGQICYTCAHGDRTLHHWQAFCEVANSIDDVMQIVDSKESRLLLAKMFADAASYFAEWRD